ncbi:dTDP-4-amino-4 [Sporomusaceae bacterium BoRhaA]|uniref:DegT/DnrJ/EryC1/StrS aminotransferase family protein n=1 Tax=Pelorhabdus rhamnosifermentans TaxID=2772457 RepID=UPI001C063230|nr:DegT/DnrJ/EryC1/StrS family aminotransferase [Pelorhabdus rhamnosifermentans]MBU2699177.1 dTDP-4-amino-4 [Pelorhabdus rhamnosifermentans]
MEKIITKAFPMYNPIGEEEAQAAAAVVRTGILSDFLGKHSEKFGGGKNVLELEKNWAEYHHVKHAISFNSATTALLAGLGALEVCPGDEVLVIGYSMCISATAPLFYGAIPVFVDIEEDYYCMDPVKIEDKITPRTKAILPVDLFGQSSDMVKINAIAKKYNLKVLSDTSHAPGCRYHEGFAGTFADVGVYSLNQHKIIHCGEGGIAVTNDDEIALRLQLIRNHAEAVVDDMGYYNLTNMVGGNYRMTETEAAIAIEQLKKLPALIESRINLANYLSEKLSKLEYLTVPKVRENAEHVYYLYPLRYDEDKAGLCREQYVENIRKLGIPLYRLAGGYIKPLYLEPIFSKKEQLKHGYPYRLLKDNEQPNYSRGICPVTEKFYDKEFIVTAYTYPPLTKSDMDDIVKVFDKAATMR